MPSSPWSYADGATTSCWPVQQYAWRHWGSTTTRTQQRKSVYHICCIWYFYSTPARSTDTTGHILLNFLLQTLLYQAMNFGKCRLQQFLAFLLYGKKTVYYGNCLECLSEIRALFIGIGLFLNELIIMIVCRTAAFVGEMLGVS
jgi:hypothetical protein